MFTSPEPVTLSREARRGRGSEPRPSNALPTKGRARLPPSRDFRTRSGSQVLDASSFSQFAITLQLSFIARPSIGFQGDSPQTPFFSGRDFTGRSYSTASVTLSQIDPAEIIALQKHARAKK